jgi:cell wall-associated NlpC family hydrolase
MIRKSLVTVAVAAGLAAGGFLPFSGGLTPAAEAAGYRTMHVGDRGPQVVWVQQQLRVRTTGLYGNETRAAVVRFQHWAHIGASGTVGPGTMLKLRQMALISAVLNSRRAHQPAPRPPVRAPSLGVRALQVAASERGKPYVYGATGPQAFDCSGLTRYVFDRLGKHLPRTTYQQYAVTHIPRGALQPGDLVFSGDLGHVGIYAGYGSMWNAPHTGARVRLERVWDPNFRVGRVH